MEVMRQIAFQIVLRACGFGSLAIFCVMIGMSFEPRLAFTTGGVFTILMCLILVAKAREARTKPYRRTELWLYLPDEKKPPEAYAQWASATVLGETYLIFAYWTAAIAIPPVTFLCATRLLAAWIAMWAIAFVFSLIGR